MEDHGLRRHWCRAARDGSLGFSVESLDAFQKDMKSLAAANTALDGASLTATKENVARLELLKKTSMSQVHLSDPDGVLLAVKEGRPH